MIARIKSGVSSAGSRPAGKTLKTSGSSKLLLTVSRPDGCTDTPSLDNVPRTFGAGEDRLRLTDEELREEVTRTLTTLDPQAACDLVEFSFKQRCFVPLPPPSHFVTLLSVESTCLLRESSEGQEQLARTYVPPPPCTSVATEIEQPAEEEGDGEDGEGGDEEGTGDGPGDADAVDETPVDEEGAPEEIAAVPEPAPVVPEMPVPPAGPPKKLTNQFNFCDRAALTYNNPYRELGTQTVPPPRTTFSINVTQWAIYDAYKEDFEQQQRDKDRKEKKEKAAAAGVLPKKEEPLRRKPDPALVDNLASRQLLAAKIIERMANQNTYDEITQDFKYWEDPSDEFREEEGTLLPLWKLSYDRAVDYHVMSLCWNMQFQDLFAVGFGSFDFRGQKSDGMMCMFTLKTPSHPEYCIVTESGVTSVDVHPTMSHLVVLGLYDGNVAVYDLQVSCVTPQYSSSAACSKHAACVWQVRWGREAVQESELSFFSVAADGQVLCWSLLQRELARMTVISLLLPSAPVPSPEGSNISLIGCGTALAFHPTEPLIFLVGTEEGRVYKCSTAYTSIFLAVSEAHYMPVHQLDYNKYDPSIYASCSGDWRVKIWEDQRAEPLFEFDLASPVGDVAWAPYSSTVFAAVTADGKVHVFDLNVNKYRPICIQTVVARKRCRLTRLAFNPRHPVLIVGDNSGSITSVKLSPNLRKKQKPPKKGVVYEHETLEKVKLEKLLALVRDPQNPVTVLDTDSST